MILFRKSSGLMKSNLVEHPREMVQAASLLKGTTKTVGLHIVTSVASDSITRGVTLGFSFFVMLCANDIRYWNNQSIMSATRGSALYMESRSVRCNRISSPVQCRAFPSCSNMERGLCSSCSRLGTEEGHHADRHCAASRNDRS